LLIRPNRRHKTRGEDVVYKWNFRSRLTLITNLSAGRPSLIRC
jgi:hypothetical protein